MVQQVAEETTPTTSRRRVDTGRTPADMTLASQRQAPSEEAIRSRAYELYERRGGEDGRDLDDWFQAERELRSNSIDATGN